MRSKFWNFIFWLVIAAAFIGPGTVTTAASAGANFQYQLLWALLFSTIACLVLQEAAARVVIVTGKGLGQVIRAQFRSSALVWLIAIAVFLGCAAYEAGNILGAISGLALITIGLPSWIFTLTIVVVAFICLYFGKVNSVANLLGLLVATMGISFLVAAFSTDIQPVDMIKGLLIPGIPEGSTVLALGLIGTTIVPYNIFLGSGMAEGKDLRSMRSGLSLSVVLGGIISMAVILVGTSIDGTFSFGALYASLTRNNGEFMGYLFAIGLFAAGFTSTITAALAGALTIKSIHGQGSMWTDKSKEYRLLWMFVLLVGLVFGVTDVKPIPVIILAQAANGFILPLLTYVLWVVVNSRKLMPRYINGWFLNILMGITMVVTSLLGLINVSKAVYSTLGITFQLSSNLLMVLGGLVLLIMLFTLRQVVRTRQSSLG